MPRVRANVTVALRQLGEHEPDVFLQGEDQFTDRGTIQRIILEAVRDMGRGDIIWYLVVPADMSVFPPHQAIPMAYYGVRPTRDQMIAQGFEVDIMREYGF